MKKSKKKKKKKETRIFVFARRVHRFTGISLFLFFLIIAITGILLAWKKQSEFIQPSSRRGTITNLDKWLPIDSLQRVANQYLVDSLGSKYSTRINKIDIRPDKGVVKFIYEYHYQEVQLDGATGDLLSLAKRNSDLIEDIHEGSILDILFLTNSTLMKVIYSSLTGLAMILFIITGIWLWLAPRRRRKRS